MRQFIAGVLMVGVFFCAPTVMAMGDINITLITKGFSQVPEGSVTVGSRTEEAGFHWLDNIGPNNKTIRYTQDYRQGDEMVNVYFGVSYAPLNKKNASITFDGTCKSLFMTSTRDGYNDFKWESYPQKLNTPDGDYNITILATYTVADNSLTISCSWP